MGPLGKGGGAEIRVVRLPGPLRGKGGEIRGIKLPEEEGGGVRLAPLCGTTKYPYCMVHIFLTIDTMFIIKENNLIK